MERELLIRLLRLEQNVNNRVEQEMEYLKTKMVGETLPENVAKNSVEGLIALYRYLLDLKEREVFKEQFQRVGLQDLAKDLAKRLQKSTVQYDALLPLIKELTRSKDAAVKQAQKYHTEMLRVKRERDSAIHAQKTATVRAEEERNKRQRLRGSYRILSTSFNNTSPSQEVASALENLRNVLTD